MYTFSNNEKEKIKAFFGACNELIDGRFILADMKISSILKCIANSEILYNLFARNLVDFNFKGEFKNAKVTNKVNGGYFVMPNEEEKILALFFCIMLDIDNGKLNLQNFVNENFYSQDGYNISYSNFAHNVLIPFKTAVIHQLGINEEGVENTAPANDLAGQVKLEDFEKEKKMVTNNEDLKILYANLMVSLNDLYNVVLKDRRTKDEKKEELYIIVSALNEAINLENILIINALMISLEQNVGKNRAVKNYYKEVQDTLISIYEILSK